MDCLQDSGVHKSGEFVFLVWGGQIFAMMSLLEQKINKIQIHRRRKRFLTDLQLKKFCFPKNTNEAFDENIKKATDAYHSKEIS